MHITETAVSLVSAKPVAPRPRCKSSVISRFPDSVVPRPFSVSLCVALGKRKPFEIAIRNGVYIYIYIGGERSSDIRIRY